MWHPHLFIFLCVRIFGEKGTVKKRYIHNTMSACVRASARREEKFIAAVGPPPRLGASASSVRRAIFSNFCHVTFFCLLVPNTHNKGCMDIFCEHLFHTVFIFFVYVQLLSSPPLIIKLFFALFARNILIVASEMGHSLFFFPLGPAACVGEGKYLGRRDCDSLGAPLLSL